MLPILKTFGIAAFVLILSAVSVSAANYWVDDPNDCPSSYQAQTCTGTELVCGYSGGVTYCYEPASLSPPGTEEISNAGDTDHATLGGGFIIDCYAYDGTEPHCDNSAGFWCNQNDTCYDTRKRKTNCTKDVWAASSCETCRTNYVNCTDDIATQGKSCEVNIDTTDCATGNNNNINGSCDCVCDGSATTGYYNCSGTGSGEWSCDVQNTGSCSVGQLSGTYSCSVGVGGCYRQPGGTQYTCTCVVDKSYFETGTFTEYSINATQDFLWGMDYGGVRNLMNLTNKTGKSFLITNNSCIMFWDGTVQCSTVNSSIQWNASYFTAEEYRNSTGDLEWITPSHIADVDLEDICGIDTCPFPKITGDNMQGNLSPNANNTLSLGNETDYFGQAWINVLKGIMGLFGSLTAGSITSNYNLTVTHTGIFTNLTVDTNSLFVDSTNNRVGIGTSSPASKLDIDTGSNTLGLRLRGIAETVEIADLYVGSNGQLVLSTANTGDTMAWIELNAENNAYGIVIRDSDTGNSAYANIFMTNAATDFLNIVINDATSTIGLVVDDNNYVGIGTSAPGYRLEVNDDVTGINVSDFLFVNSTNVGIGTANPSETVDLSSGNLVTTGSIIVHSTGVKLTGDGDGALTFLGLGNGYDENLIMNLDDYSNEVRLSSGTGVTKIGLGSIDLLTSGQIYFTDTSNYIEKDIDGLHLYATGDVLTLTADYVELDTSYPVDFGSAGVQVGIDASVMTEGVHGGSGFEFVDALDDWTPLTGHSFLSEAKEDTDFDEDEVLNTGISSNVGILMVRENVDDVSAIVHIDLSTPRLISSDGASFSTTKDNAGTYNVYHESNYYRVQNKVGDNKNVKVGYFGIL